MERERVQSERFGIDNFKIPPKPPRTRASHNLSQRESACRERRLTLNYFLHVSLSVASVCLSVCLSVCVCLSN